MHAIASDSPPHNSADNAALHAMIRAEIVLAGGWLPFDRFMHLALYAPGLGYYAHGSTKLGQMPRDGSDFVTSPEISPLFGQTLAVQVAEALQHTGTNEVWEFGAGSGALAEQVLDALQAQGVPARRYTIVDVSGSLRARQQQRLARFGDVVQWANQLPVKMQGVVLGNEVLDAMPVQLLVRKQGAWYERGVALNEGEAASSAGAAASAATAAPALLWQDRTTSLRPPLELPGDHDYLTEIHSQAEAFIATLGQHLQRGAAFFIDYGFGEREYYHPQRHMGTLMCHRLHKADDNPLHDVGDKDITAHVNFTGIAVAAQDAGLELLGYTTQGWFLLNCGIAQRMEQASLPWRALAQKLVFEHEMGELFKVIGLCKGEPWPACGFTQGDRLRTL